MSEVITDDEDRDRMISQAMSLLLASSRVNHILHDAALEVDKELDRLRAENERLTAWLTHIKNTGDEFGFIAEEALDGTPFEPGPTS